MIKPHKLLPFPPLLFSEKFPFVHYNTPENKKGKKTQES